MTSPPFNAAQPAGGAGSPPPVTSPSARRGGGRAGKRLMIVGGVIIVLSLLVGGIIFAIGAVRTSDPGIEFELIDGGSTTLTLEEGEAVQLYHPEGSTVPSCTVTGPEGAQPELLDAQSGSVDMDSLTWVAFEGHRATAAGEHEISCPGESIVIGPQMALGAIFGMVGGMLAVISGGFVGFVVLLVGLVLWLVQRNRA